MKMLHVRITTTEGMLGMNPSNKQVYRDFIGSKAPDAPTMEEEVELLGADEVAQKGMTIFKKLADGTPIIQDYQIKGMLKDCCGGLRRVKGSESSKVKAYKKAIDQNIFVYPRNIPIRTNQEMDLCERPLRAQTMQGERVSLACSEEIQPGAVLEFEIKCEVDTDLELVVECLDKGLDRGLGQWRNSGKGRFYWEGKDSDGFRYGNKDEYESELKGGYQWSVALD